MHKPIKTYATVLLSTAVLSQSVAYGALAASTGATPVAKSTAAAVFTLDKLGSVAVKKNVSVKLMDMDIFAEPGGNILTYTLLYSNGSESRMDHIDYFSKVTTPGGTVVQGKPITEDATKKTVPANSSQTITYYVNIGKAAKINGVKVSLFGWDFSSANYQKRLGTFTVPGNYSAVVPNGQSQKIMMNNLPITVKAESLQKIQLNGKVYMKVGVSLTNSGKKALSDPGFTAYLKSAGGSVFKLALDDASSQYEVQPQEKKTIYYLAEVPSYMKTDNMTMQFVKEDETLKLNLPVKSFKLPAVTGNNPAVEDYAVKKIMIANNAVETQLKTTSVYAENDSAKWSLQFRIKNLGNKPVTLPAYEVAIKAAEGYSIPVNAKALANLTLKPLEEKIINLGADVPLKLNQGTLQLQLIAPADPGKIVFPTAQYKIPYAQESNNLIGQEYMVENSHGRFGVKLESFQRLPWGDKDQIAAKISIRNISQNTEQLPELKALVKAGMNDLSGSAQLVSTNVQTSLAPNETTEMYVTATIPYTFDLNELRMILVEPTEEDMTKFLTLNTKAVNNVMKSVDAGSSFLFDIPGKRAEVRERFSTVYSSNGSNIMYTELEMNNDEERESKQAQLVAYYKTPDNQYYKAEISQTSNAVSPDGKSLVTVWSKLPQRVNTSQLTLYVGEGIADGKLTDPGETSTGYINTVKLSLSPTAVTPASNLKNVDMFPYTLSMTQAEGSMSEGSDVLNTIIHYKLSKNENYELGDYEHKLIMEFIDPYGQSTEKTLTLGTDFTIGNNKTYVTSFNSSLYRKLKGGSFRVNLYDEFQGHRILLGSQSFPIIYEQIKDKDE